LPSKGGLLACRELLIYLMYKDREDRVANLIVLYYYCFRLIFICFYLKIMQPPPNAELFETMTSVMWKDENGIICSSSKKHPPVTLEQSKKDLELFRKRFGDEKHCMLLDITNSTPSSKEVRDFAAEELPKMVKALALVSNSPLGKMVANLFFGLKPPSYPTKMFTDETAAREWLKQYL
jgi:hypothetical protein